MAWSFRCDPSVAMERTMLAPSAEFRFAARLPDAAIDYRSFKACADRLRSEFMTELLRSALATLASAAKRFAGKHGPFSWRARRAR